MKKMVLGVLVMAFAIAMAAPAAQAGTITYDFTYSGSDTYVPGGTTTGNGSFAYTGTLGSPTGVLSDFSLMLTDTAGALTSTLAYGFGDVASSSIVVNPTTDALANITIATNYLFGSNASFGPTAFFLNFSGVVFDSTGGKNTGIASNWLDAFSSGGGTVTPDTTPSPAPAVTPEPSSLILMGTGILGLAAVLRKGQKVLLN